MRFIQIPKNYLISIATVSDRIPKLYYHPLAIARNFFWMRLSGLFNMAKKHIKRWETGLDFACGSGIFLPTLATMFDRVVGVDLETAEANQLVKDYHLDNVELIKGDINHLDLEEHFDAIFAADVLEHFSDLKLPARKIYSWLKKDGLLFTSVPTENTFTRLTRMVGGYQKPWDHYHTGKEVEDFLSTHGFLRIGSKIIVPFFPLYYLGVWRKV